MAAQREHAPIVVGIDGSWAAQYALDWAATEAQAMRRPLHLVHGFTWPVRTTQLGLLSIELTGDLQTAAERVLADAEARAQLAAPDIKVTGELVVGASAHALLRKAYEAELVVVGAHGGGEIAGRLVGSVPLAVAAYAPCPVVVVRPGQHGRQRLYSVGRVVVGADGSTLSAAAVRFAFQAAARRRVGLTVVRVWTPSTSPTPTVPIDRIERAERQQLRESLEVDRKVFPQVDVKARLVRDNDPGRVLVAKSAGASLAVVGAHSYGRGAGLLGSVSQSVLEHARCPVAVVRPHP